MSAYFPSGSRVLPTRFDSTGYSRSVRRLDLPEPETPVTTVRTPRGKLTEMPLRLCSAAPIRRTAAPFPSLRRRGSETFMVPARNIPVRDERERRICS